MIWGHESQFSGLFLDKKRIKREILKRTNGVLLLIISIKAIILGFMFTEIISTSMTVLRNIVLLNRETWEILLF